MKFRPSEGRKRVFVLDEADRLNVTASNALLKTLEEPPPATVLILVTARPHHLPATVLSRCQHIRFNPLPRETIALFLTERLGLAADKARLISASAGGSIARALDMNKEDFLAIREAVMSGLGSGWQGKPLAPLAFLSAWRGNRNDISVRLEILRSCFRDALVYGETGDQGNLVNGDHAALIAEMARRLAGPVLIDCLDAIDGAERALEANANRTLTLEVMAFKLAAVW
jgi:DNA polymerase-3 subunit delta'